MKTLSITLILLCILSSCVFSGKPNRNFDDENKLEGVSNNQYDLNSKLLGDSIVVDTVVDNYRLFYKVSEIRDTALVAFSCDENASEKELYQVDRMILLNIQALDTTSIVDINPLLFHRYFVSLIYGKRRFQKS